MNNLKNISSKIGLVIFWSVISAAFIGPGTVTTAANAGSSFGLDLLWALVFATVATIFLQEAAVRIPLGSGLSIGEVLSRKMGNKVGTGIRFSIAMAIIFGSAAYQAGNILGSVSGITLISSIDFKIAILVLVIICSLILWKGNPEKIAKFLGIVVALMGFAFVWTATKSHLNIGEVLVHSVKPSMPDGSGLLLIGLIGTTIVPYNLFLASGLKHGQSLKEIRIGIIIAVIIGGIISMAILMVGTLSPSPFSFQGLYDVMSRQLDPLAGALVGIGLFAAGFTSSLTAPLASALTAKMMFSDSDHHWEASSVKYRSVWLFVMGTGFIVGIFGFKPIPVILLAQAINGVLLPFVTFFIIFCLNDRKLIPEGYRNHPFSNIILLLIQLITTFLGMNNLVKGIGGFFSWEPDLDFSFHFVFPSALVTTLLLAYLIFRSGKDQA